jgi:hypothetical protein
MKLTKRFHNRRFPVEILRKAMTRIDDLSSGQHTYTSHSMMLQIGEDAWDFDNFEDFFADYPNADQANFNYRLLKSDHPTCAIDCYLDARGSAISITAEHRHQINSVMNIFQQSLGSTTPIHAPSEQDEQDSAYTIFIGHGRSKAWRELKDHLEDKHDLRD